MASRKELRAAMRSQMVEATQGLVDPQNIRVIEPDDAERIPAVAYADNYSRVVYNGVGIAPDYEVKNEDGVVEQQVWRQYLEGRFDIQIRARGGELADDIYDAIHSQFQQYQFHGWDESDVHPDIANMWVGSVSGSNDGAAHPVFRGDVVEVFVVFFRDYVLDVPPIERIETEFDINFSDNETGVPSGPVQITE